MPSSSCGIGDHKKKVRKMTNTKRKAGVERVTQETNIKLEIILDGKGHSKIRTGIPFLEHMLSLFSKHGLFNLTIAAKGDTKIDIHHTNEDIGICMGEAIKKALGDKKRIRRFGFANVPMDGALARVVLDIGGRGSLFLTHLDGSTPLIEADILHPVKKLQNYSLEHARQFLSALTRIAGINMDVSARPNIDMHHALEAIFKAFGIALSQAVQIDTRVKGIPSIKGRL